MRPIVGFLCPTLWDRRQLEACRAAWAPSLDVLALGPDDGEVRWDLDAVALVEQLARANPHLRGATSSSDYPGAVVAALLARRLGLPGSEPRTVLACGHKAQSRALQARAAPEAVPWFRVLDPRCSATLPADLELPCFVKPVRGSFSLLARQVDDADALRAFLAHPAVSEHARYYAQLHRTLQRALEPDGPDPGAFLAEGLLQGVQVTLEGWIDADGVHVLGIVDSVMVPGTRAFARFETPSALPALVQERMRGLAQRVVPALGLTQTAFNIELIWDEGRDTLHVIEVNPRLCGQFGDLWQKTLDVNGYEVALALALGRPVPRPSTGRWAYAASVPLRTFQPVRVLEAPDAERIAAVERAHPDALVWWECARGEVLEGFDAAGEGQGLRYAVLNLGAASRAGLVERSEALQADLGARLVPRSTRP